MSDDEARLLVAICGAVGPIGAAVILGIVANRIRDRYQVEKDRQDKDAQWRQHAIDLTKLELERKVEFLKVTTGEKREIRSVIDDFLAFYRDLNELGPTGQGEKSVRQLYVDILERRTIFRAGQVVAQVRLKLAHGDIKAAEDLVLEAKIHAMEEALQSSSTPSRPAAG